MARGACSVFSICGQEEDSSAGQHPVDFSIEAQQQAGAFMSIWQDAGEGKKPIPIPTKTNPTMTWRIFNMGTVYPFGPGLSNSS